MAPQRSSPQRLCHLDQELVSAYSTFSNFDQNSQCDSRLFSENFVLHLCSWRHIGPCRSARWLDALRESWWEFPGVPESGRAGRALADCVHRYVGSATDSGYSAGQPARAVAAETRALGQNSRCEVRIGRFGREYIVVFAVQAIRTRRFARVPGDCEQSNPLHAPRCEYQESLLSFATVR